MAEPLVTSPIYLDMALQESVPLAELNASPQVQVVLNQLVIGFKFFQKSISSFFSSTLKT